MREFPVCQSIIEQIKKQTEQFKPGTWRLVRAHVRMDGVRRCDPETLAKVYTTLTKGSPFEGSVLDVVLGPLQAVCKACGKRQEVVENIFQCHSCGSISGEIGGGNEFNLVNLEIEEDE